MKIPNKSQISTRYKTATQNNRHPLTFPGHPLTLPGHATHQFILVYLHTKERKLVVMVDIVFLINLSTKLVFIDSTCQVLSPSVFI